MLQQLVRDEMYVSSAPTFTLQPSCSLALVRVLLLVEAEVVQRHLAALAVALLAPNHTLKRALLLSGTASRQLHMRYALWRRPHEYRGVSAARWQHSSKQVSVAENERPMDGAT